MQIPLKLKKILLIVNRNSHLIVKLVIIDQIAKWWFMGYLRNKPSLTLEVSSFFSMVYSWNYGISFGLLRNYYQYSNIFFMVLNSAIVAYLWYNSLRCKTAPSFIGYNFIIGGAIGNLIDRFINGAVFDFIYFHYQDIGFPIFNLADGFISLGAMFLLYDYYKTQKIVE